MYTTAAFVSFVSLINRFSPPMEAMMCSSICVSYIFNFDYVFTFSVVLFVNENYSYIISQHLWTSLKQRCVAYYFKIWPLNEHSQKSWTCTFWIVFALRPALLWFCLCIIVLKHICKHNLTYHSNFSTNKVTAHRRVLACWSSSTYYRLNLLFGVYKRSTPTAAHITIWSATKQAYMNTLLCG